MPRVLAIDDEPRSICSSIEALREDGHEVVCVDNLSAAAKEVRADDFDLVVSDSIGVPLLSEMARGALGERNARVPFVLLTGYSDIDAPGTELRGSPGFRGRILKGSAATPQLRRIAKAIAALQATDVAVLHAAADAAWAGWIAGVFAERGGAALTLQDSGPREWSESWLAGSTRVLVLVSERALRSPWLRADVTRTIAEGRPLTPVIVESSVVLPRELSALPAIDIAALPRAQAGDLLVSGEVPSPQPSARNWLPPAPDAGFIGRERELALLAQALGAPGARPARIVVVGPPGIGKTCLAGAFVDRYRGRFQQVLWARGAKVEEIFASTGEAQGVHPGLLVIDDPRDYHSASHLIAAHSKLDVLITSCDSRWGDPFEVLPFGPLDFDAAVELMRKTVPRATRPEMQALVSAIGRSPQHLVSAGWLAGRDGTLAALIEQAAALDPVIEHGGEAMEGSYYLATDDPAAISTFERALCDALERRGSEIELLLPRRGSWKRKFRRRYNPERLDAIADKVERAAEVAGLTGPEGEANRNNAEAMNQLLEATASLDEAVLLSGSVLVVKVDSGGRKRAFGKTLSATEMRRLEEDEAALSDPIQAMAFLDRIGEHQQLSPATEPLQRPPAGELED